MDLDLRPVPYGSEAWKASVDLRGSVLRAPLGSSFSAAELEEEEQHVHVAGYMDGALVATAVLVPEGSDMKMQRVAVLETLRNKNIGSRMLAFCETYAMDHGHGRLYCHARESAVVFYAKNGYVSEGAYFQEDGIPHLCMAKAITG